jgi:hypothetical protein
LQETRHVDYFTPIFFLRCPHSGILGILHSIRAAKMPAAISRKRVASAFGARPCCVATEVFFANDGAVSRLRCRSKVAQKAFS